MNFFKSTFRLGKVSNYLFCGSDLNQEVSRPKSRFEALFSFLMVRRMTEQNKIDKSIYGKEVAERFRKYYERKVAEDPEYMDKLKVQHNERRKEQRKNNPSEYARHKAKVKLSYWNKLKLSLDKDEFQKRLTRLKTQNRNTFELLMNNGFNSEDLEVKIDVHDEEKDNQS